MFEAIQKFPKAGSSATTGSDVKPKQADTEATARPCGLRCLCRLRLLFWSETIRVFAPELQPGLLRRPVQRQIGWEHMANSTAVTMSHTD